MHHKALTIQTRSLDQRLLAAVITIEIAFGNISNIITFSVTNPIAVFRRAFRLDILLFNQDSYPASIYLWCSTCPLVFGRCELSHVIFLKLRKKELLAKLSKFTK